MPKHHLESVPAVMQPTYTAVMALIDPFCQQYLDDEYAVLCRKLAGMLVRKRPSPLVRGHIEIWACAIVYAVGSVNFLFDRTQKPYMSAEALCEVFAVSYSSGANKARLIRDLLDMVPFDTRWCLPSRMDKNPMAWLLQVDGFLVDARSMPRTLQEVAFQKGLIPYIPADHQALSGNDEKTLVLKEHVAPKF